VINAWTGKFTPAHTSCQKAETGQPLDIHALWVWWEVMNGFQNYKDP